MLFLAVVLAEVFLAVLVVFFVVVFLLLAAVVFFVVVFLLLAAVVLLLVVFLPRRILAFWQVEGAVVKLLLRSDQSRI